MNDASDTATRNAIIAFLNAHPVTGMRRWYRDMPTILTADKWQLGVNAGPEGGFGAVGYIHLDQQQETRITVGGTNPAGMPQGQKAVSRVVSLLVAYQHMLPADATALDGDEWVNGLDEILDGLVSLIRTDPTLGNPDVVFQAGQDTQDLVLQRDLPVISNRVVQSWNRLELHLLQIITA